MMDKNDGGPAFPRAPFDVNDYTGDGSPGMTMRDWFAATATEADVRWHRHASRDWAGNPRDDECSPEVAKFRYADAMLEARK